jgi:4-amino-4-deoxy-L-arabinose transferase-like glycosyltransferase
MNDPISRKPDPALVVLLGGWLLLSIAAIWLRPLWPVDETRYASVAWEMWLRGDFLVPYINGEPYSHKPPLLFWLIHAGWAVFGVNEWWPRMVAPLCALATVPLQLKLGRLLWPAARETQLASVWILFGTLLFAGFITLTMFDLLLLLCAMAGMAGVLHLAQGDRLKGLLWLGAGIGFGVLTKGPVILLHVLPAAVLAPWWQPALRARWGRWLLDLLLGVLLGAAIALAWAGPAAWIGGEVYRHAIFWGQTAGRVSESFAHRAPWWYYLPQLPVIFFPWLLWPRLWKGARALGADWRSPAVGFLLAWLLLTLLGFSLVSGKQAKYLLPFAPAFALLAGHALTRVAKPPAAWEFVLPASAFIALPAFLAWLRARPATLKLPEWAAQLPLWPIVVLGLLCVGLLLLTRRSAAVQLRALSFGTLAAAAVIYAGIAPVFAPYGDPAPAARQLAALQEKGVPLAHLGKYHATYNFAGRLTRPIAIIDPPELPAWVKANPQGQVITVERSRHAGGATGPEFQAPFRGAWLQLWHGGALVQARPELR